VTGAPASAAELCSPEYWVRQLRQPVRFRDAVERLESDGTTLFVEVGPGTALTAPARDSLTDRERAVVPLLKPGAPEPEALRAALAEAHLNGMTVDWAAYFEGSDARRVDLPTYAFQRRRYWLAPAPRQTDQAHPVLGPAVTAPDIEGAVFTGELDARVLPWLTGHRVAGTAVLPGAAFLELALHAGTELGCPAVEDLVLRAPLPVPEHGTLPLRLSVREPDDHGRRSFTVYAATDGDWTAHAAGTLSPDTARPPSPPAQWPPAGATAVDLTGAYERLTEAGLAYGPAFRGLRAVWRLGDELFAEAALPDDTDPGSFALHPALLDACLHVLGLGEDGRPAPAVLPFSWRGVRLHATGARTVRVHLTPDAASGAVSLELTDAGGTPVASVAALALRPVTDGRPPAADRALLRLDWIRPDAAQPPATTPDTSTWTVIGPSRVGPFLRAADLASVPENADTVLVPFQEPADPLSPEPLRRALELIRGWLADPLRERSRLVVVTRRAVAAAPGEDVEDLAHAPLWGLLRTAATEHPGRFAVVDVDGEEASWRALPAAVAAHTTQVAVRQGEPLVPRLVPGTSGAVTGTPFGPAGTVLVTGAAGGLGGLITRHLVAAHGVRHVLLAGRRADDPRLSALAAEVDRLGGTATLAGCDVGDRAALAALLRCTTAPSASCGSRTRARSRSTRRAGATSTRSPTTPRSASSACGWRPRRSASRRCARPIASRTRSSPPSRTTCARRSRRSAASRTTSPPAATSARS
jgi:acyl transferase domain-containing protein